MKKIAAFALAMILGVALTLGIQSRTAQAGERHPKIHAALTALEEAREEMRHADHDFGGHRVEAIKACDRAIEQLREALKYDR